MYGARWKRGGGEDGEIFTLTMAFLTYTRHAWHSVTSGLVKGETPVVLRKLGAPV